MARSFFILPKPTLPTDGAWAGLSQSVQNLWNSWAIGNNVSDIDFRNQPRTTVTAFQLLAANKSTDDGASSFFELPPPLPTFEPGVVGADTFVPNDNPGFFFVVVKTPTAAQLYHVWASPPYADTDPLDLTTLVYLGRFGVLTDANPNDFTTDMAADYNAIFPHLQDNVGKLVTVFLFNYSNGQEQFAGAVTKPIIAV